MISPRWRRFTRSLQPTQRKIAGALLSEKKKTLLPNQRLSSCSTPSFCRTPPQFSVTLTHTPSRWGIMPQAWTDDLYEKQLIRPINGMLHCSQGILMKIYTSFAFCSFSSTHSKNQKMSLLCVVTTFIKEKKHQLDVFGVFFPLTNMSTLLGNLFTVSQRRSSLILRKNKVAAFIWQRISACLTSFQSASERVIQSRQTDAIHVSGKSKVDLEWNITNNIIQYRKGMLQHHLLHQEWKKKKKNWCTVA